MVGTGPNEAGILVLVTRPSAMAFSQSTPLAGWEKDFIYDKLLAAGIHPNTVRFETAGSLSKPISCFKVVIGLGPAALSYVDKTGIDKWQNSVFKLDKTHFIPCYDIQRINKQYELQMFMSLAFQKAADILSGKWYRPEVTAHINPPFDITMDILDEIKKYDKVSLDIETSYGQINTMGFAWKRDEGIAIGCLPDKLGPDKTKQLWTRMAEIIEGPSKKILQNAIYEYGYYSMYGFRMANVWHDTMWAQKVLWPEFKQGLDNVGRMYTPFLYWKEDNKNWNKIKDWPQHYRYNVSDTVGTLWAAEEQEADLKSRGLADGFYNEIMQYHEWIAEMCTRGLPLNVETLKKLQTEVTTKIVDETKKLVEFTGQDINPRSPKQIKDYYNGKGYKLPKKRNPGTGTWVESTDQMALKKLRLKYPADKSLAHLLNISTLNKAKSSYLDFKFWPDNRLRYMLNGCGTETLRWSGSKDILWGGINPQTVPNGAKGINIKAIFEAPSGKVFLECDLGQAESRFVAYDCCDNALITMLEDPAQDVHKFVASEIFKKPIDEITKQERQLGKKSGHGANYSMGVTTFIDSCLREMDLVLTKKEGTNVLESYHRLFPGIRRGHESTRREVRRNRKLTNPFKRERYFFGRLGDDLFRESYAYRPQSSIPEITNCLIRRLVEERGRGRFHFELILQIHDSVLMLVDTNMVDEVAEFCLNTSLWHPEVILPAGRLIIPTDCEVGKIWGNKETWDRGKYAIAHTKRKS